MVYATTITVAALLAAIPVKAGLYTKSSPVVQVDAKNYDRLIAQSNYTSVSMPSPRVTTYLPVRSSSSMLRGAGTARISNPPTKRLPKTWPVWPK